MMSRERVCVSYGDLFPLAGDDTAGSVSVAAWIFELQIFVAWTEINVEFVIESRIILNKEFFLKCSYCGHTKLTANAVVLCSITCLFLILFVFLSHLCLDLPGSVWCLVEKYCECVCVREGEREREK